MDLKLLFHKSVRTLDRKSNLGFKSELKRSHTFSEAGDLATRSPNRMSKGVKGLNRKNSCRKVSRPVISPPQDFVHIIHWPYQ